MTAKPGLAQNDFYSCTDMATVGVKGLNKKRHQRTMIGICGGNYDENT